MSEPIDYVEKTAGFVAGEVYDTGRKVNRPNAQVTAIAIYESAMTGEDITYQTMYSVLTPAITEWASKPGRVSKHRRTWRDAIRNDKPMTLSRYRMPMEFLRPWIEARYPVVWVATAWIGAGPKLHLDTGIFGDEKVVLARLSSDEVIPVLDGIAHYPWDPNCNLAPNESRMVYGYWTKP